MHATPNRYISKFLSTVCIAGCTFFGYIYATKEYGFGIQPDNKDFVGDIQIKGIEKGGQLANQEGNLIELIKGGANWILGLLGMVALLVLLYGGFQMLTAAGDDGKYQSGTKYLKTAGTALIYIAIARFLVSMLFYILRFTTG